MAFDGTTGSLPGAVFGELAGGLVEGLSVDTPIVEPRETVNGATTSSIVVVVVLADGTAGPLTDLVVDRLDDGLLELLADEVVDVVVDKLPAILLVEESDGRPRVVRVAIVVGSLGVGVLIEGTTDGRFSSTVDAVVVVDVSVVLGDVVAVDFSGGFADGVVNVVFSGEVVGELAGALSTDRAAEFWVVVDGVGSTVTEGSVVVDVVLIDGTTGGLDCGGGGEALLEVVVVGGSVDGVAVLADSDVDVLLVVGGGGGGVVVVVVDGTTTFVVCGVVVVVVVRDVMILSSVVGDNVVVSGNVIGAGGGGVVVGSSGLETGMLLFLKFCRLICRGK